MKIFKALSLIALIVSLGMVYSCDENGDFVIFSIQNDKDLGEQVKAEIAADPNQFPILSRASNATAYSIMDGMLNDILTSGEVTYADEFDWELFIIDDPTLNAFATPGGKIYVYSGLVYFLDHADDLMGVLGHEVAHSDQRHSSKQLQRVYGISVLLEVLAGGQSELTQEILGSLVGVGALSFSRDAEVEADDFSVTYLSNTSYACNGAAAFFQKLIDRQAAGDTPEFLSTHPAAQSRVDDINAMATDIGCSSTLRDADRSELQALKDALP